jgi:hypothetical protein
MITHICRMCRKAKGTRGPYEDIIDGSTYFLCFPCYDEQEVRWLELMDVVIAEQEQGDPFDDPIFN